MAAESVDAHLPAVRSFPRELETVVRHVSAEISIGELLPPVARSYQVQLRGETLHMPIRVYYDRSSVL